jgi:mono/diheme cytochrome c family protein
MKSRSLRFLICLGVAGSVFSLCRNGSAQNKSEDQFNPDATHLIASMDGAVLYKEYCATCHGTDGKGFGPMTEWLKIKAPDLTRISIREGGKFPLARVQRIISGEENITAGHGTREMPIWGPIFSQVSRDQDLGQMRVYNLAKFVEGMQQK